MIVCPDTDGIDGIKNVQFFQLCFPCFQIRRVFYKVRFVDDGNGRAAALAQSIHQNHFRLVQGTIGLKQHHGNVHIRDRVAGCLVHPLAQLIVRLVDARSVQQDILERTAGHNAGNAGPGGLRLGGNDRHLLPDQTVRQTGLAHIGALGRPMTATKTDEVS